MILQGSVEPVDKHINQHSQMSAQVAHTDIHYDSFQQ